MGVSGSAGEGSSVSQGARGSFVPAEIKSDLLCCVDRDNCATALGMESGAILDAQLSDSGAFAGSQPRLNAQGSNAAWIFSGPAGKLHTFGETWYQVDFGKSVSLAGVGSQGRGDRSYWVTSYKVRFAMSDPAQYPNDGVADESDIWSFAQQRVDIGGGLSAWQDHVFSANSDRSTVVKNWFESPVTARYVRVYPMSAKTITAMRLEFYGGDAGVCAPSLTYGSRVFVKSMHTGLFLDSSSGKFDATSADLDRSAFVLRHPGMVTDGVGEAGMFSVENVSLGAGGNAATLGTSVVYGGLIALESAAVGNSGRFLSYNMGSAADANVAKTAYGTTVAVSASFDEAAFPPSLIMSGSSFAWLSASGEESSTVTFDLKSSHIISKISINFGANRGAGAYAVLRSLDGSAWVQVGDDHTGLNCAPATDTLVNGRRVDSISGWAEPTRFVRLALSQTCNGASDDEDKPYYEVFEIAVVGRAEDTNGAYLTFSNKSGMTNATFQVLDARLQPTALSSADSCTPASRLTSDQRGPRRMLSLQHEPTQAVMLRRMGTASSFGCFLGVDVNTGSLVSELFGGGNDNSANIATNRFQILSADAVYNGPGKVAMSSLMIATNSTPPPQVEWKSPLSVGGAITGVISDGFSAHWNPVPSFGGPETLFLNLSVREDRHHIEEFELISNSQRTASDQFTIAVLGGANPAGSPYVGRKTGCLQWNATADTVQSAILSGKLAGEKEVRAIHVSRHASKIYPSFGYRWLVTFVRVSATADDVLIPMPNFTVTYGGEDGEECTTGWTATTTDALIDAWGLSQTVRPHAIAYTSIDAIPPQVTSYSFGGTGGNMALHGFSTYALRVAASNVLGFSLSSRLLATTTGDIIVPEAIATAPTATFIGAVDLIVQWPTIPRSGGSDILGYYLYCQRNTSASIIDKAEVMAFSRPVPVLDKRWYRTFLGKIINTPGNSRIHVQTASTTDPSSSIQRDGDIDNPDLSDLIDVSTNKLHPDIVLSFEFFLSSEEFAPASFEHTSSADPSNGIFLDFVPPPEGWAKNTWSLYQATMPDTVFKNPSKIDWTSMDRLVIVRTGSGVLLSDEQKENVLIFRNWKYTPGIQRVEPNADRTGKVVGLVGENHYQINVAPYNAVGKASWSPTTQVLSTTTAVVPSKPEGPPVLTSSSPDRLEATWELPYFGGSPILGYRLILHSRLAEVQVISLGTQLWKSP